MNETSSGQMDALNDFSKFFFQNYEHHYSNNVSSDENFRWVSTKANLCYSIFEFVDICSPWVPLLPLIFWKLGHGLCVGLISKCVF